MDNAKKEATKPAKKEPKAKKAIKPKKEARKPIEVSEANLKVVRSVGMMMFPLPAVKKALSCTWKEAVALRRAALKAQ